MAYHATQPTFCNNYTTLSDSFRAEELKRSAPLMNTFDSPDGLDHEGQLGSPVRDAAVWDESPSATQKLFHIDASPAGFPATRSTCITPNPLFSRRVAPSTPSPGPSFTWISRGASLSPYSPSAFWPSSPSPSLPRASLLPSVPRLRSPQPSSSRRTSLSRESSSSLSSRESLSPSPSRISAASSSSSEVSATTQASPVQTGRRSNGKVPCGPNARKMATRKIAQKKTARPRVPKPAPIPKATRATRSRASSVQPPLPSGSGTAASTAAPVPVVSTSLEPVIIPGPGLPIRCEFSGCNVVLDPSEKVIQAHMIQEHYPFREYRSGSKVRCAWGTCDTINGRGDMGRHIAEIHLVGRVDSWKCPIVGCSSTCLRKSAMSRHITGTRHGAK